MSFVDEIRRRKVVRVAALYAASGFATLEAAGLLVSGLGLPDSALRVLTIAVVAGFPVALVLGWVLDRTPTGVRSTSDADSEGGHAEVDAPLIDLRTAVVAGGLVIFGLGLGTGFLLGPAEPDPDATQTPNDDRPAVLAVAPLELRGEGVAVEWPELIARSVATEIERAQRDVISVADVIGATVEGGSVVDAARVAGATHVITGTLTTIGDQARVDLSVVFSDGTLIRRLDPIEGELEQLDELADTVVARATAAGLALTGLGSRNWAVSSLPPTVDAYRRMGEMYGVFGERDWLGAAALARSVLEDYPDYPPALVQLLPAYFNAGPPHRGAPRDSIIERLRSMTDRLTTFEQTQLEWVIAPTRAASLRAARLGYEVAPWWWGYNLAWSAMRIHRLDEALLGIEADFELNDDCRWQPAWTLRTTLHHLREEYEEELAWARSSRECYDVDMHLLRAEARALIALDSLDAARQVIEQIKVLPGPSVLALALLGRDAIVHGQSEFGQELLSEGRALFDPASLDDLTLAGNTLYYLGDWERLLPVAERRLAESESTSWGAFRNMVSALEGLGRSEEADRMAAERAALGAHGYLAALSLMRGDVSGVVDALGAALDQGWFLYSNIGFWIHRGPWDPSIYEAPEYWALLEVAAAAAGH